MPIGGERAQEGVARVLEPIVGQLLVEQPGDRDRVVLRDRDTQSLSALVVRHQGARYAVGC